MGQAGIAHNMMLHKIRMLEANRSAESYSGDIIGTWQGFRRAR
jgi:hypothetical protein